MLSNENFTVRPLPTIVFNRGAANDLNNHIQALGKSAALIVTDKNLAASGVLDPILEALRAANLSVEVFDGVEPNPTDLNVEAGAEKLKELGDAVVVPIGGGSSMDCGKSIALLASNPGTVEEMQGSAPTPAAEAEEARLQELRRQLEAEEARRRQVESHDLTFPSPSPSLRGGFLLLLFPLISWWRCSPRLPSPLVIVIGF